MSSLVAWSPVQGSNGPLIFSVHASRPPLTLEAYLGDLSQRIQVMFDLSPESSPEFQQILEAGGLLNGPLTVQPGRQAQMLVYSNPNLPERLTNLGLPANLRDLYPTEMPEAREQLRQDRVDPQSRLLAWASAVGTMR